MNIILKTLLETTTSLLHHDLHWSLAHLHSAVRRALHPRQDSCNICLQQYKRKQDSTEEIVVFRYSSETALLPLRLHWGHHVSTQLLHS